MAIVPVVEVELSRLGSPSSLLELLSDIPAACATFALLVVAAAAAVLGVARHIVLVVVTYRNGRSVISRSVSFSNLSFSSDDEDEQEEDDDEDDAEEDDAVDENDSILSPPPSSEEFESSEGRDADLPEMSWTGPVVRTWKGSGFTIDRTGDVIALLDLNRREILRSFRATPSSAASLATPVLLVTADSADDGSEAKVAMWDARSSGSAPEAEWPTLLRRRRAVRVAAGADGKVYLGDEGGGVVVADLRNRQAEQLAGGWLDADAVNVLDGAGSGEEVFDHYGWRGARLVVEWCCNAARRFPILPSP